SDHGRLCDCGFVPVRSQLETWDALGARHRADAQPDPAPVVLRLDFTARRVARRLCLERSFGHTFRLLPVLGRTTFWFAVACGAVDAGANYCPGDRCVDHARYPKENGGWSDLTASSRSFGSGASKFFPSSVRGC